MKFISILLTFFSASFSFGRTISKTPSAEEESIFSASTLSESEKR